MIRWITDTLGTAAFTDPAVKSVDRVLDVRDLVDKRGNTAFATREKIDQGVALLRQGYRLVICCDYGISRSNAIAAGVLSQFSAISLVEAVQRVIRATGEHEIKLEPLSSVRSALLGGVAETNFGAPRLLLTGGSGFIGGRLRAALGEKFFWIAPKRNEADLAAGALGLDLLVKEHSIDCIVHLANPRIYTSSRAMGETVTLLRNALEVCRENHIRLIYPSGWEVYSGFRACDFLVDEGAPLYPKGPYGETKMLCEGLIELYRKQYGLRCAILRSSPLYGESSDRPKFLHNFLSKARAGETIRTHRYLNGDPKLDFLHVDDFVAAIVAAIERNFFGTLNIGSGQLVSTREVAEWIVRECSSNSDIESRAIEDRVANIAMDHRRAGMEIGWCPTINWQDGMAAIVQSVFKT